MDEAATVSIDVQIECSRAQHAAMRIITSRAFVSHSASMTKKGVTTATVLGPIFNAAIAVATAPAYNAGTYATTGRSQTIGAAGEAIDIEVDAAAGVGAAGEAIEVDAAMGVGAASEAIEVDATM